LRARAEEVLEAVASCLSQGSFASFAGTKAVLTGGASQLPGLRDLASAILQRPVRLGQGANLNGLVEHQRTASFAVASGALIHAANPERLYAVPEQAQAQFERARMGYAARMTRWLAEAF
jgi:cell division protein FtsA